MVPATKDRIDYRLYNSVFHFVCCYRFSKVVERTKKQLDKLWHTTNIYLHPNIHEFSLELTSKLPGDLKVKDVLVKKKCMLMIDWLALF